MDVLDEFGQSSERVDQIVAKSDRMGRSKTEPVQSLDLMHRFEQLHERGFTVAFREFVTAVKINDLTEQRNFLHTVSHQLLHFPHDLRDRSAAFGSARLRHDTEGAMHVASLHDGNESGRLFCGEFLFANRFLRTGFFINIDDGKSWIVPAPGGAFFEEILHIVRDAMKLLGADDKIDMRQMLQERAGACLRQATKKTKNHMRPGSR